MDRTTALNPDENDVYAPFSEACGSREILREKLRLISYCQDRSFKPEKVIRRLRFLSLAAAAQHPLLATTPYEAAETCTQCAQYPLFDAARDARNNHTSEELCRLRLTDLGDLESCKHYVAVSYCWRQPQSPSEEETLAPRYKVLDGEKERECRAPLNVIRRAIDFAIFKGYRLIWIDQECIDQDDVEDKLLHIQAMHLIYRQASDVVAVLNSLLDNQAQVDILECDSLHELEEQYAFNHLESSEPRKQIRRNLVTQTIRLAESLASDPWYTRAWTYQEALLATRPVYLLILCQSNLRAPSFQIAVGSQLVIYDTKTASILESMLNHLDPYYSTLPASFRPPDYGLWLEDLEDCKMQKDKLSSAMDILKDSVPGWKEPSLRVALEVHRLSARDAIQNLLRRGITDCLDLIAICGNICNYSVRLDTDMIRKAHIGLSVALFALALLNGDVSLVLALNRNTTCSITDSSKALPTASMKEVAIFPRNYEFIDWVARSIYGCRVRSPTLLSNGLLMRGILWRIQNIDMSTIRQKYIQYEDSIIQEDCPARIVQEIVNVTCRFLKERNEIALARAIETTYKHRQQRLVSRIMRCCCISIAIPEDPAISGCKLLPETAYKYGTFEDEIDHDALIFGANRPAYVFTPYRVLIEQEIRDGIPWFLLMWWISRIETTPKTIQNEDLAQKETRTIPTMTNIFSQGWPIKMKVDEKLFIGDVKKLITSYSLSEEIYRLHCF